MGIMGRNGMNNNRRVGDKTTPIGLFQLNTPFGQSDPQEGFPADYIKVGKRHVWSDLTNRLVEDASVEGEHVGTKGYQGYYDYALDAGFNVNAIPDQGSALFLHCWKVGRVDTSGCVAIPKEQMAYIMKLYGMYGKGACYIAQAPRDTFELVYDSYGVNGGLSPQETSAGRESRASQIKSGFSRLSRSHGNRDFTKYIIHTPGKSTLQKDITVG